MMNKKITFINKSMNKNLPKVFVFPKNRASDFNCFESGVAWKVISDIGRESVSQFYLRSEYTIRAAWNQGLDRTASISAMLGKRYAVKKNRTGIVIEKSGSALTQDSIELVNDVRVDGGVLAQICNDGCVYMGKKIVAFDQVAIFKPDEKVYWGLASEIVEGRGMGSGSAVLSSHQFFELDMTNVTASTVSLNGNAKNGYHFRVEESH